VKENYTLARLVAYFLRLGATGFGGPAALAAAMHEDLVVRRGWISEAEYKEGLTLAQLAPGPMATQLAIYLGWLRARNRGATLVGVAFVAPSFFIVLAISEIYLRLNGLPVVQSLFYGIGAAVISIIALSVWKLSRRTLDRDPVLWGLAVLSFAYTAATGTESVWIFLAAGLFAPLWKMRGSLGVGRVNLVLPAWMLTGIHGPADPASLGKIFGYFTKAGAMVFGSGLAIVPFLRGGVVDQFHWLTERQFLDAVAVAMITPGPVVITVAFIGYLVAGVSGATASALGVFLPCYLLVVLPAPYYQRFSKNERVKLFIGGVTSAAIGAIAGALVIIARRAITDGWTVAIAGLTLFALLRLKRIPEPVLILLAGAAGIWVMG
jgi:chromate transporter